MRRRLVVSCVAAGLALALSGSGADAGVRGGAGDAGVPGRTVAAERETPALFDDDAGGAADADDPAIWVHPTRRSQSLVIATAKNAGLFVYRLNGSQAQHVPAPAAPGPEDEAGRFNNVDVAYGFRLGGRQVDLAVTTDRGRDRLRIYAIDPARAARGAPLADVTDPQAPFVFSADQAQVNDQATAYGLALWRRGGQTYALVSRRHATRLALVRLYATAAGTVGYQVVRTLDLPARFTLPDGQTWTPCAEPGELPQVEGMVVDADRGVLYAAQEDVGIWRLPAALTGRPALLDRVREFGVPATFDPQTEECVAGPDPGFGGEHLSADAEGLTIYHRRGGRGYLLASSQGDSTFVVYRREGGNAFIGSLRMGAGRVDGVEHCDGAAVVNVGLGAFGKGLLVVHDGENTPAVTDPAGEPRPNTNFKFVRWEKVARAFRPGLAVEPTGWSPM